MAGSTVYESLKGYLSDQLSPMRVIDYDEIDPALQQGTDSFIVLDDGSGADESMLGFGFSAALAMRESSSISIYAYVASPHSSAEVRALLDSIRGLLRFRRLMDGAVRIDEITPPEFEAANDGLWTIGVITALLDYDFTFAMPA